jgi:hypothetical protein
MRGPPAIRASGDRVATEDSPLQPPAARRWSVDHLQWALRASAVHGIVIHPAMIFERDGGVFASVRDYIARIGSVRFVASKGVRWPLVHHDDIGTLYAFALERECASQFLQRIGHQKPLHTDPVAEVSLSRCAGGARVAVCHCL